MSVKFTILLVSIFFGVTRIGFEFFEVDLSKHAEQSYQAFAHIWMGMLLGAALMFKRMSNNVQEFIEKDWRFAVMKQALDGEPVFDLEQRKKWLMYPFWILSAIELFSALILPRLLH